MKIVIETDADLTPPGKRAWRIVRWHKDGRAIRPTLAWYVGGKLYRYLPITKESLDLSDRWLTAA